jgi:hypothetical protein
MTWQPIKTAPKDQIILVYGNAKNGDQAEFGQRIAVAKHYFEIKTVSLGKYQMFVYVDGEGIRPDKCIIPSHWMPLPKPPTTKDEEND